MSGMKKLEDARRTWREFEELTRRLIVVPRAELEKELAEYERKKRQRTSSRRASGSEGPNSGTEIHSNGHPRKSSMKSPT